MTSSKRMALLGIQSALSVAKRGRLGFIDRRPFPYRQISAFTKETNPSKSIEMESLQDAKSSLVKPELTNSRLRTLEAEVGKVKTELMHMGHYSRQWAILQANLHSRREALRADTAKLQAEFGVKSDFPTKTFGAAIIVLTSALIVVCGLG